MALPRYSPQFKIVMKSSIFGSLRIIYSMDMDFKHGNIPLFTLFGAGSTSRSMLL